MDTVQITKEAPKGMEGYNWNKYWERNSGVDSRPGRVTVLGSEEIWKLDQRKGSVLEIGCGNLRKSPVVGRRYTGIDISEKAIELARMETEELAIFNPEREISLIVANAAERLPLPDAQFDLLFALEAMPLFGLALPEVLRECLRVMKPGGAIVYDMVHPDNFVGMEEIIKSNNLVLRETELGTLFVRESGNVITCTEEQTVAVMKDAGFENISLQVWSEEASQRYAETCLRLNHHAEHLDIERCPQGEKKETIIVTALKRG